MTISRLFKVEAAFGSKPTDAFPRWEDISDRVTDFTARRGRSYELDRIEAGQATIQLDNPDGQFTPGRDWIVVFEERFNALAHTPGEATFALDSGQWAYDAPTPGSTLGATAGGGMSITVPASPDMAETHINFPIEGQANGRWPIKAGDQVRVSFRARATSPVPAGNIFLGADVIFLAGEEYQYSSGFGGGAVNGQWHESSHVIYVDPGTPLPIDNMRFGLAGSQDEDGVHDLTLDFAWFRVEIQNPRAGQLKTRVPIRAYTVLDDNWIHQDCVNAVAENVVTEYDLAPLISPRWSSRYEFPTNDVDSFAIGSIEFDDLKQHPVFALYNSNGEFAQVFTAGLFGDSDVIHVEAGQSITVDVDVRPGPYEPAEAAAALFFMPYNGGPADEVYVQAINATDPTQWHHSTLTYTAPAAGYILPGVWSAGDPQMVRICNMKARRDGIGSPTVAGASGLYPAFRGFSERWTSRHAGRKSTTELSCVDTLTMLNRPLETFHRGQVRRFILDIYNHPHLSSFHYWPCVESAESKSAVPLFGTVPLKIKSNVPAASSNQPGFTGTKTMDHADGSQSGGFTNAGDTDTQGAVLTLTDFGQPAMPRDRCVGVSFWYRGQLPPSGQTWQLFAAMNAASTVILGIELASSGYVTFRYSANGLPTGDLALTPNVQVIPDEPIAIGVSVGTNPGDSTGMTAYMGGGGWGLPDQLVVNPLPPITFAQFGGLLTPNVTGKFVRGTINHILWATGEQWTTNESTPGELVRLANRWGDDIPVMEAKPAPRDWTADPGQLDLNLDSALWRGSRILDPGLSLLLSPRWDDGANALDVLSGAASSADGVFFAGPAGEMAYHNRHRRMSAPMRWTLREWVDGLEFELDDQKVYNQVTAERSTGMTRTALDQTSIDEQGIKALKVTRNVDDPDELKASAGWLLHRYREGSPRCDVLTVDATAVATPFDDHLLALAHGANMSDRLRLFDLPDTAPAANLEFFVEGVSVSVKVDGERLKWLTTLQVSDSSRSRGWILEDFTTGALETSTCALAY